MKKKDYKSSVLIATPMLTDQHIEIPKKWAEAHLQDNWSRTIFTDETVFDLFRNKVCRWHKNGEKPIRQLPKITTKSDGMGGGGIS
jgi:hypothetical protein